MNISVVVPIYKSQNTLELLYSRLETTLNQIAECWEVVFVNDGSPDSSWEKIEWLIKSKSNIVGVKFSRNFGQHNALLAGIRRTRFSTIITLDDDLQNPPEEISKLLIKISEGYDLVYGIPEKKQHSFFRNLSSSITRITLSSIMGASAARNVTSFRVFKKTLTSAFDDYNGDFVSVDALLSWGTNKIGQTSVLHEERKEGTSNYSFKKLMRHCLTMMTSYSSLPLRVASFVGFVCTTFGVGILFYVLGRYFIEGDSVPGFPFLASVISIFSGAQLFSLGIIGEYLGRVHFRSMGKPSYVIENVITSKNLSKPILEKAS